MNLRDMKRKSGMEMESPVMAEEPDYSYGLRISLDDAELDKLDIDINDVKAGKTVTITAEAKVVHSCSRDEMEDGEVKNYRSCSLQIQKMAIHKPEMNGDSLKVVASKANY